MKVRQTVFSSGNCWFSGCSGFKKGVVVEVEDRGDFPLQIMESRGSPSLWSVYPPGSICPVGGYPV